MSVSRCLTQAVKALQGTPRSQWKTYIDSLPAQCPHTDCTAQPGCRDYVAAYLRVQWNAQTNRERMEARRVR
jgi:hypothetical protein